MMRSGKKMKYFARLLGVRPNNRSRAIEIRHFSKKHLRSFRSREYDERTAENRQEVPIIHRRSFEEEKRKRRPRSSLIACLGASLCSAGLRQRGKRLCLRCFGTTWSRCPDTKQGGFAGRNPCLTQTERPGYPASIPISVPAHLCDKSVKVLKTSNVTNLGKP